MEKNTPNTSTEIQNSIEKPASIESKESKETVEHKKKSKNTSSTKHKIASIFGTGFFLVLSIIIIAPVFIGFFASFRPGQELVRYGMRLKLNFSEMSLNNYNYLFSGNADSIKYFNWFKNSMILTIVSVVLTLLICYIVAYGFSMYNFKFKNLLFFLVIATMMVPFEILMLPLYQEIIALKLTDTYTGVVIIGLCGASTIFFFRQFMIGIPKELLDAGRIDGATEYGICFKIMLPITKPAFAAMGILSAMGAWNSMLWPLLVLRSADKFTLTIGLNTLLTPYGNNYDMLIAGSMLAILPIFVLFLLFQRYFIEGMTTGAVKG